MSPPRRNLTLSEKKQQAKEIKEILMSGAKMNTDESLATNPLAKKIMNLNKPKTTSIIRIVPGDVKNLLTPKKVKKLTTIKRPVKVTLVQTQSSASTSSSTQLTDHCYLKKLKSQKSSKEDANESTNESDGDDDFSEFIQFNDIKQETDDNHKRSNAMKRSLENSISTIPEKIQKVHSEHCCCSCKETLDIIMQQQQEILKILRKDFSCRKKLDLLPNMPFNDMNDFLDFDESLSHENVRDQFAIKIKKLMVSTDQKSVSNIMSSLVTNELCRNISWIGVKNSLAFGSTNMVQLIIDVIQEHHGLNVDVIKTRIAEWLRRCGDRIGNEIRKNKKRAEQGYAS